MELRPGAYFKMDGEPRQFVGVPKGTNLAPRQDIEFVDDQDSAFGFHVDITEGTIDPSTVQAVLRLNPDNHTEALHQLVTFKDIQERGSDFWDFGEKLTYIDFQRQYEENIQVLTNAGVISSGYLSFLTNNIYGNRVSYSVPRMEALRDIMLSEKEKFQKKTAQGFTRLVLVPFAVPLWLLRDELSVSLVAESNSGKLQTYFINSQPARIDIRNPVSIPMLRSPRDIRHEFLYDPHDLSEHHNAKTKREAVASLDNTKFPGWHVLLLQESRAIRPVKRDDIRVGAKAWRDLLTLTGIEDPGIEYHSEEFLTVEDYLSYARLEVESKHIVPYAGRDLYLLGNCIQTSIKNRGEEMKISYSVPGIRWKEGKGFEVDRRDPDHSYTNATIITAVPIK